MFGTVRYRSETFSFSLTFRHQWRTNTECNKDYKDSSKSSLILKLLKKFHSCQGVLLKNAFSFSHLVDRIFISNSPFRYSTRSNLGSVTWENTKILTINLLVVYICSSPSLWSAWHFNWWCKHRWLPFGSPHNFPKKLLSSWFFFWLKKNNPSRFAFVLYRTVPYGIGTVVGLFYFVQYCTSTRMYVRNKSLVNSYSNPIFWYQNPPSFSDMR